ncbi:MAG: hypothetical protein KF696_01760 [Planctomycetes bacterium]|nr:hypothetical protein [Planctomycetota bacterium]MCW8134702.1 hypothetical protein [Planctomycetota bacterium]
MYRMGAFALLLSLALGAGVLHAGVEVGDQGANFKFDKSWNVPQGFTELDQYRGKVVMIERWATW